MNHFSWLAGATLILAVGCDGDSSSDSVAGGGSGGDNSGGSSTNASGAGGSGGAVNGSGGGSGGAVNGSGGGGEGGEGGVDPVGGNGTGGDGGGSTGNTPVHIVILGASSSCGKNLDQPQYGGEVGGLAFSWPNRYVAYLGQTRPGSVIDNLCQSGYNTYHAMPTGTQNPPGLPAVDPAKNITAALALMPDAIIVSFPAANESSNVNEIMSNLVTIEATAAAQNVPIWVSTPQPNEMMTAGDLANKLALRSDIVAEFAAATLDFWAPLVGPNNSWDQSKMLTDGVHPNKIGHGLLFDEVVAADIPGAISP